MTTNTADAQADAEAAKNAVDQAEADLVSGKRSISAEVLHKVTDRWRHATLSAQRDLSRTQEAHHRARLEGLAAIGAEVDKLAQPDRAGALAEALRDVADACDKVRTIAAAHDADVAELAAAAADLQAEPAAPGGPRATSAFVAVSGRSVIHKRTKLSPVSDRIAQALQHALNGDLGRAAAEVQSAVHSPDPKRPDYLLRGNGGMLIPIHGELNDGMQSHIRTGGVQQLPDYDIDRYMKGELA